MEPTEASTNPYAAPAPVQTDATSEASDTIECEGCPSIDEGIQAALLPVKARLRALFAFFFWLAFFAAMLAVHQWLWERDEKLWIGAAFFAGLFVLCPIAYRAWIVRNVRKGYDHSPLASEPYRVRISAEAIESSSPTFCVTMRWEAFYCFTESEEMLSLCSNHYVGYWYPLFRNHFVPADWERFRKLVATKLPRC